MSLKNLFLVKHTISKYFSCRSYSETLKVIFQKEEFLSHYESLEWRFDVKIGSRSCLDQIEPQVMLKLHLSSEPEVTVKKMSEATSRLEADSLIKDLSKKDIVLQTDPSNLTHLCSVLEEALSQINTSHVRRHLKNL